MPLIATIVVTVLALAGACGRDAPFEEGWLAVGRRQPNIVEKIMRAVIVTNLEGGFPRLVELVEWAMSAPAHEVRDGIARLSGRRVCPACGGTYHISHLKGDTCEKCGGKLIQRDDDKAETVLSRLSVYHAQTAPLIDYYDARGLLRKVDGSAPMDDCFSAILSALGETK